MLCYVRGSALYEDSVPQDSVDSVCVGVSECLFKELNMNLFNSAFFFGGRGRGLYDNIIEGLTHLKQSLLIIL